MPVSVILGLGLAHLRAGVGQMIHRRGRYRADAVHLLWTGATFWILVLDWWVFFQSRTFDGGSFDHRRR